MTTRETE